MPSKERQHYLFMNQVDFYGKVNFLGPVNLLGAISNIGIADSLPPGSVVAVISTGPVVADSSDLSHAGRVVGVSTGVTAITDGEISFSGWSFTTGDILYLTSIGTLTSAVPTVGFQQRVGVATSPTSMIVSLTDPIILA